MVETKKTIVVEEYAGDSAEMREVLDNLPRRIRGRLDIMAYIVEACTNGLLKTGIMYRTNLSHEQLTTYLTRALERGLVEIKVVGEGKFAETKYFATEEGRKYLSLTRHLQKMLYVPRTLQR
jgi:predicted transcriptional regulator